LLDKKHPTCECGCGEKVSYGVYYTNTHKHGHRSVYWQQFLLKDDMEKIGRKIAKTKKDRRIYEYSNNPENWRIQCEGNDDCIITCTRYEHFASLCKKKELGIPVYCISCVQVGKVMSEEFREKCRNRIFTEERRKKGGESTRLRYLNMTEEERQEVSRIQREANLKAWNNATEDRRKERLRRRDEALKNLPPEKQAEKNKKISDNIKDRMEKYGGLHEGFAPGYNPDTIPYIVDILNVKYDTEFRHAECKEGEFKIYDKELRRFYYADAYSRELNIWVEFDEGWHFNRKTQELNESCKNREDRIRKILDCQILRINFNKRTYSKEYL
jgi:hypothetical protein